MRNLVAFVGLVLASLHLVVACSSTAPPPLAPLDGRASVLHLGLAVRAAAEACTANARHLGAYALPSCDPLRPTTTIDVLVDPRIAPCPPGACGPYPSGPLAADFAKVLP